MWQKIKEVIKLYKKWFLSVINTLILICFLIFGLIVMILSAPFITSKKVQNVLQCMFDDVERFLY